MSNTLEQQIEWGRQGAELKYKNLPPFSERFWKRVKMGEQNECWLWTGSKMKTGYGQFPVKRKVTLTHRIAWTLTFGPIPQGLNVCHHCDNPTCCNPYHLFLGTQKENLADAAIKKRIRSGERHHAAKLTNQAVVNIRQALMEGVKTIELAKRHGVSSSTILSVKHGAWRHV